MPGGCDDCDRRADDEFINYTFGFEVLQCRQQPLRIIAWDAKRNWQQTVYCLEESLKFTSPQPAQAPSCRHSKIAVRWRPTHEITAMPAKLPEKLRWERSGNSSAAAGLRDPMKQSVPRATPMARGAFGTRPAHCATPRVRRGGLGLHVRPALRPVGSRLQC